MVRLPIAEPQCKNEVEHPSAHFRGQCQHTGLSCSFQHFAKQPKRRTSLQAKSGCHNLAPMIVMNTDIIGGHCEGRRDSSGTDLRGREKGVVSQQKLTANKTARTKHRVVSRHVWCDALTKSESMRQHQATFHSIFPHKSCFSDTVLFTLFHIFHARLADKRNSQS